MKQRSKEVTTEERRGNEIAQRRRGFPETEWNKERKGAKHEGFALSSRMGRIPPHPRCFRKSGK
jgi:hypothetical protein